ncbi:MAG: peptidyl-prolyl cis-trans isomerase [Lachnospiraceae bacterium]|nr:peptidyl-prolyl cis-trans isomerase [Lachnospiraceae bacterium]
MARKFMTALTAATLVGTMLFTGCGASEALDADATLVSVDGKEVISAGYGNFVAKYNQATYDQIYVQYFGSVVWDQQTGEGDETFEESVKTQIMDDLERYYVSGLHASDYNIALTDDQKKAIAEAAKKLMDANSEEAIQQLGATEEYAVRFMEEQTIAQQLQDAIEAEAEVNITDEEAEQSTISYVTFANTKTDDAGNTVELDKTELVALKESAEKLSAAADFAAEAEAQELTPQTYSYTKTADPAEDTTLGEAVIAAAQKLSDGETSAVIEVEGTGYYVVHMEATSDQEATATKRENLEKDARNTYYTDKMDAWKKDVDWKVDKKLWGKVTFKEYFTTPETTEETTAETTEEE